MALKQEDESDYILKHDSVWISVDNISVYIKRTDEGVVVDLYPKGGEMRDPIGGTYAFFQEARDAMDPQEDEIA